MFEIICPRQKGGYNCGVYLLEFARHVLKGTWKQRYSKKQITLARQQITMRIIDANEWLEKNHKAVDVVAQTTTEEELDAEAKYVRTGVDLTGQPGSMATSTSAAADQEPPKAPGSDLESPLRTRKHGIGQIPPPPSIEDYDWNTKVNEKFSRKKKGEEEKMQRWKQKKAARRKGEKRNQSEHTYASEMCGKIIHIPPEHEIHEASHLKTHRNNIAYLIVGYTHHLSNQKKRLFWILDHHGYPEKTLFPLNRKELLAIQNRNVTNTQPAQESRTCPLCSREHAEKRNICARCIDKCDDHINPPNGTDPPETPIPWDADTQMHLAHKLCGLEVKDNRANGERIGTIRGAHQDPNDNSLISYSVDFSSDGGLTPQTPQRLTEMILEWNDAPSITEKRKANPKYRYPKVSVPVSIIRDPDAPKFLISVQNVNGRMGHHKRNGVITTPTPRTKSGGKKRRRRAEADESSKIASKLLAQARRHNIAMSSLFVAAATASAPDDCTHDLVAWEDVG